MTNLFVRILHMSSSAGYLILAVLAVRFLLKKAPKTMRIFLWLLVGIRLALPFSIESAFSLIPDMPSVDEHIYRLEALPQTLNDSLGAPELPILLPEEDMENAPSAPSAVRISGAPFYLRIGAGVWIAGMAVMAAYLFVSWIKLTGRVKTAVPVDIELDGSHTVRAYQSEHIDSPFLFGIVRPRIYIPERLDKTDLPYVVLHEVMHWERRDHLIKLLSFLILSVYWFNPLVWAAFLMLCRDIELICDEQVICRIGEPYKKAYSQALLDSAAARRTVSAYPVAFGGNGVRERVENVLHYKKPAFWVILAAVLACVLVSVCFMTQPRAAASQQADGAPAGIADAGSSSGISFAGLPSGLPDAGTSANISGAGSSSGTDGRKAPGAGASDLQSAPDRGAASLPADRNREAVDRWAQAFCERDGRAIADMLADGARQELSDKCNFTQFEDGSVEFGFSSPWPWASDWGNASGTRNYRIVSLTDNSAEILYYAWVSDPHVTVWREQLAYRMAGERCEITSESIQFMSDVCTAEELEQAYPGLVIAGTVMDYSLNGAGEILNGRPEEALLKPDTAAVLPAEPAG